MRYYLFKIAYNKVAMAEDRPQPTAYNTYDEAEKNYHGFFYQNELAPTIGWCMAFVVSEQGVCNLQPKVWEDPNIGEYYGTFIIDGTINEKTGEAWKIEDVPERFRPQTQAWVDAHTPVEPEQTEEQPTEQSQEG